jgi:hypothetical protein
MPELPEPDSGRPAARRTPRIRLLVKKAVHDNKTELADFLQTPSGISAILDQRPDIALVDISASLGESLRSVFHRHAGLRGG